MEIGTATGEPGTLTEGELRVTELPTGAPEALPVLIAEGAEPGPTLWITASIHSDEVTGLAVAQDAMSAELAERIRGTVVCIPVLNPAGLRQTSRTSYYHGDDPNRYFAGVGADADGGRPPKVQELINRRVFDIICDTADALVSLHTSWVNSFPYTISPRVTYGNRRTESEAEALAAELRGMTEAFGFPVVNQFPREEALGRSLDRALTEALVVEEGIPAFTPELGGRLVVEEDVREAAVEGVENVLRALDMLDGSPRPVEGAPDSPVDYPVRRAVHPQTDTPGVVRYRVSEGDAVEPGDVVADIVTQHGRHKRSVRTEYEGYVLSRHEGSTAYENDPVADLAVRDESPFVVEY